MDEDNGIPSREIGLDATGIPVVAAPFNENYGFWTDSNMIFDWTEHENIDNIAFEEMWKRFEQKWQQKDGLSSA